MSDRTLSDTVGAEHDVPRPAVRSVKYLFAQETFDNTVIPRLTSDPANEVIYKRNSQQHAGLAVNKSQIRSPLIIYVINDVNIIAMCNWYLRNNR